MFVYVVMRIARAKLIHDCQSLEAKRLELADSIVVLTQVNWERL
jgi:hypothetical protein